MFSSSLEKLPLWLQHNISLLWCNFHWNKLNKVIWCSHGLLKFEIEFHLPSKSANTIKLSPLFSSMKWPFMMPHLYLLNQATLLLSKTLKVKFSIYRFLFCFWSVEFGFYKSMYVFVCERGSLRFCVLNKFHFLRGFGKYLVMNEESVKERWMRKR